jgi:hypothetical protein
VLRQKANTGMLHFKQQEFDNIDAPIETNLRNLRTSWLFEVGCQNPQPKWQQTFKKNYAHTKLELHDSFL